MARYISGGNPYTDIRHYQKKLVPLNLVVCILCLVSIFTLMFLPILRIDISKMVSNQEFTAYVKEMISDSQNPGSEGGSDSDSGNSGDLVSVLANSIVDPLLKNMGESDISLNFTAFSSLKVLMGGGDAFKEELNGMVTNLTAGLVDSVMDLFTDGKIVNAIVDEALPAMITSSIESFKTDPETPQEVKDRLNDLSDEQVKELCDDLKGLQDTKTPEEFVDKFVDVAPDLMLTLTGESLEGEQLDAFRDEIAKMVNESVANVKEQDPDKEFDYNLEAFICLQFSGNFDFGGLGGAGQSDGNSSVTYVSYKAVDTEDGNGGSENNSEGSKKLYTSFGEMIGETDKEQIRESISTAVNEALDEIEGDIDQLAQGYGYLFVFVGVFMGLWLILFLFSFFHMFAKNKRFMMWYVKLLCWIPGTIWLSLTLMANTALLPTILGIFSGALNTEIPAGILTIMNAIMGGLSSWGTGVSYICYWVLWLVSIFWAFPIKHKIRKFKKQAKGR